MTLIADSIELLEKFSAHPAIAELITNVKPLAHSTYPSMIKSDIIQPIKNQITKILKQFSHDEKKDEISLRLTLQCLNFLLITRFGQSNELLQATINKKEIYDHGKNLYGITSSNNNSVTNGLFFLQVAAQMKCKDAAYLLAEIYSNHFNYLYEELPSSHTNTTVFDLKQSHKYLELAAKLGHNDAIKRALFLHVHGNSQLDILPNREMADKLYHQFASSSSSPIERYRIRLRMLQAFLGSEDKEKLSQTFDVQTAKGENADKKEYITLLKELTIKYSTPDFTQLANSYFQKLGKDPDRRENMHYYLCVLYGLDDNTEIYHLALNYLTLATTNEEYLNLALTLLEKGAEGKDPQNKFLCSRKLAELYQHEIVMTDDTTNRKEKFLSYLHDAANVTAFNPTELAKAKCDLIISYYIGIPSIGLAVDHNKANEIISTITDAKTALCMVNHILSLKEITLPHVELGLMFAFKYANPKDIAAIKQPVLSLIDIAKLLHSNKTASDSKKITTHADTLKKRWLSHNKMTNSLKSVSPVHADLFLAGDDLANNYPKAANGIDIKRTIVSPSLNKTRSINEQSDVENKFAKLLQYTTYYSRNGLLPPSFQNIQGNSSQALVPAVTFAVKANVPPSPKNEFRGNHYQWSWT